MENYLLGLVLLICVITDLRSRTILNIVTLPTIGIGIIYHTSMDGWGGFLFSGAGFLAGLGLLLIPFLLGGTGAGDVKLLAAIGALKGAYFVFYAFLYTALVGGVIAVLVLLIRRRLFSTLKQMLWSLWIFSDWKSRIASTNNPDNPPIPYGVAIAIGTVLAGIWGG